MQLNECPVADAVHTQGHPAKGSLDAGSWDFPVRLLLMVRFPIGRSVVEQHGMEYYERMFYFFPLYSPQLH